MTRLFDAPRTLVFDAWTEPELVKRWLAGPPGNTLETCEIDLRPGGRLPLRLAPPEWTRDGDER